MAQTLLSGEVPIHCCQFGPLGAAGLLAYGREQTLVVCAYDGRVTLDPLLRLHQDVAPICLAWSPSSSHGSGSGGGSAVATATAAAAPLLSSRSSSSSLYLCVAGADHCLRIFYFDLAGEQTVLLLDGHTARVNAVAYDTTGQWVASTSDDRTARVWSAESGNQLTAIQLESPGVGLAWHPPDVTTDNSARFVVAERRGLVRMFQKPNPSPILSLQARIRPLADVSWNTLKPMRLGAATANSSWCTWNYEHSAIPDQEGIPAPAHQGSLFRWSPVAADIFAVSGRSSVAIMHLGHDLSVSMMADADAHAVDMSWHSRLPLCVVAAGSCLLLLSSAQ